NYEINMLACNSSYKLRQVLALLIIWTELL
ncbi:hypothetical protein VCHENC02_0242B, partial [Vibrio harveyi]